MKPGLLPVAWIEVLPRRQAASMRARIAGSSAAGFWNSMRVVTMLAPDSSSRQISSIAADMRHVEHAVGLQREHVFDAVGGGTPIGARPASSPASRPALLALCT